MKFLISKNKVFILGLLAAISVVLQEFVGQPTIDPKVLLFAVLMALLAYLANQWRGQGLSIAGIVGNLAGVFITVHETGNFTWVQFLLQGIIALIAVASTPPEAIAKK